MAKTGITYADAGVNIDAGNALVERIKPLAKATMRSGVMGGVGGFGALFDLKACGYKDPILVSGTDGVGTKIKLAIEAGKHDTIGIDLVAMCVNDLVVQGAEPLFFLDYFATSSLDTGIAADVVSGIAEGCKQAGCALVGGETAEMPGMYTAGDYDLAGFAVGAVEREGLLPSTAIAQGDILLGLASSGFHSNGYSLVRRVVADSNIELDDALPFASGKTVSEALLVPTRIYVKSCLQAVKAHGKAVKAFAHITGGGITENLPRVLPGSASAEIQRSAWQWPELFGWLQRHGNITESEMLRTFNCGIGMLVVVCAEEAAAVTATFQSAGETVFTLGRITEGRKERVIYV